MKDKCITIIQKQIIMKLLFDDEVLASFKTSTRIWKDSAGGMVLDFLVKWFLWNGLQTRGLVSNFKAC